MSEQSTKEESTGEGKYEKKESVMKEGKVRAKYPQSNTSARAHIKIHPHIFLCQSFHFSRGARGVYSLCQGFDSLCSSLGPYLSLPFTHTDTGINLALLPCQQQLASSLRTYIYTRTHTHTHTSRPAHQPHPATSHYHPPWAPTPTRTHTHKHTHTHTH